jgi:O-antigen/teichoic acid export membrane protein/glycosyltransferase involved in cell wall biosynthesis
MTFLEESAIVTGRIWFGAIYQSGTEVVRSLAILLVATLTRDLSTILMAAALVALLKVFVSSGLGWRMGLIGFEWDRSVVRAIWKYAMPVSLAAMLGVFSTSGDQMVVSSIMSSAAFAIYATGCLTVAPLMIIEQSVTRVLIPQLSEAFASGRAKNAARLYRIAVEQLSWLLIPAVVGLIVFARPIIVLLFTEQYAVSAHYLRWFALSYLMMIFPYDVVPRARGEGRWILKNFLIFAPIPLVLCLALGLKFAAIGALAGMLISRLLMRAYGVYYIRSSTDWRFRDFLPLGEMAIFTGVSFALAAGCLALRPELGNGLKWLMLAGGSFAVLYFPIVLVLSNLRRRRRPIGEGEVGRVLLFSQHLGVGGLERLVLTLGQTLQQSGRWKVFVFSHDSDETSESYTDRTLIGDFLKVGIPVDALKKGSGICFKTLYRLVRNIYKNKIDVIHSHDMGTLVYAVLANFLSFGRVRIIHTQHSFVHINRHKRYQLYEKIFTKFVDRLTVVNESLVAPYLELGVARQRIHVIHNGVSFANSPILCRAEKLERRKRVISDLPESARSLVEPFAGAHWLLYMARLHSVKGQREASHLWRSLSPEFRSESVLIIVGPEAEAGERARVLEMFEGVPNRERVIFLEGTRSPHEWIASSDLFISCSKFEGMPLGPMEAIGSGLPAVLSAIDGHRFLENVSGQYALGTPAEGAQLIERMLKDPNFSTPDYYSELWKKSEWIRSQYSLEAMAGQYAEFYAG